MCRDIGETAELKRGLALRPELLANRIQSAHAGVVRIQYVHIGETYLVEIPHRLPGNRYPADALGFGLWWQLTALRGTRFR